MNRALTRYRIIAYVVGVFLLILVLVAVPLKHLAHQPTLSAIVGPLHGLLYMVYLVIAFDLAVRARWNWGFTALILLAGTVPFLSFAAERAVTRRVRATVAAASAEPAESTTIR
jgi:integral membrane protein